MYLKQIFIFHILVLLSLMLHGGIAHAGDFADYRFHRMPETSYYGGIHSIAKDSVGRIWFTGYDAVYMFDGIEFVRMKTKASSFSPSSNWAYNQVVTDRAGRLYIGTNIGLLRYDYEQDDFDFVLKGNVGYITSRPDGTVWMIRDNGIESFRGEDLPHTMKYPLPEGFPFDPFSLSLSCDEDKIFVSSKGQIYNLDPVTGKYKLFIDFGNPDISVEDIVTNNDDLYVMTLTDGVFKYDSEGLMVRHFDVSDTPGTSVVAKDIAIDKTGIIWVATLSGIILIDPKTDNVKRLTADLYDPYSIPNNSVWSVYQEIGGGIWIGTYGGYLAQMNFSDDGVSWISASPGKLNHSIVSCFAEDSKGNIWIGTEGKGLNYWDRRTNRFKYYTAEEGSGLLSNMVKHLSYDRDSVLYVSTFKGGIMSFNPADGHFSNKFTFSVPSTIYDFVNEGESGLWTCDPDADMQFIDIAAHRSVRAEFYDSTGTLKSLRGQALFHDNRGLLGVITSDGVYMVEPHTRKIVYHYVLDNYSYSTNNISAYCISSDGYIWFGSRNGINRLGPDGEYVHFRDSSGEDLDGKTVFGILEDNASGDIWFSTDDGLFTLRKKDNLLYKSKIDVPNQCGAYYMRSCFKTSLGEMLFGGTNGFIIFTPAKIKINMQKPRVFFISLKVKDNIVLPGKGSPISKSLATMSGDPKSMIRLSHKMSTFEVSFSSDSYLKSDKNQYMFRMIGQSDKWTLLPPGQKTLQFFNMPAGRYKLEIKASNNDGVWGDTVASLNFRIKPHPLLSWWAYLLYAFGSAAIAFLTYIYYRDKHQLQVNLEGKEKELEGKEKELEGKEQELSTLYKKKYVAGPSEIVVSDMDDAIIKKAMELVERNMDNSEYDVPSFVSDMGIGRTVLYEKIQKITGMSIKEFILDLRLKRARQLLKESMYTVSEISYMTGFINPKYFSTCYKKHYGHSPSDDR